MMIEEADPRISAGHRALDAHWDLIGPSDGDVISYMINPQFQGAPPWPNTRQAYRVVRPPRSLIISSDGLSDPFVGTEMESANGFEMEVYIETPDLVGADFATLRESWAFRVLENLAQNVADWGGITGDLRKLGIMSLELPSEGMLPAEWLSSDGTAGLLVNLPAPGRPPEIKSMPFSPVMIVPVTLLRPDELRYVVGGGNAARKEVAARLAGATGHLSSLTRASVVAPGTKRR